MELLVMRKEHWMTAYGDAETLIGTLIARKVIDGSEKSQEVLRRKFNARYRPGDIVEVREDGHYTGRRLSDKERAAFYVVSVPGAPDMSLMQADETVVDEGKKTEVRTLIKRRRYRVDANSMTATADDSIKTADARHVEDKRG